MIYTKIKEIRLRQKMTLGFIASQLQLSVPYYVAIEKGEIDLELSKILRITEILGITAYDLFDGTEIKFKDTDLLD